MAYYIDLRIALQSVGVERVGIYVKKGRTYLSICFETLTEKQIEDTRYLLSMYNYNLL